MRPFRSILSWAMASLLLSGCASVANRVEATRFHLGQEIERGSIRVAPSDPALADSLETRKYAEVIGQEIALAGFRATDAGDTGQVLLFTVKRTVRDAGAARSPVTIGIGGGTGGGGFGVGVGTSFPVGTPTARQLVTSELNLRIRRQRDNTVVWEGRAVTEAVATTASADPRTAVARLTRALFQGFPGESGKTITVK